jgi:hypothetical protein
MDERRERDRVLKFCLSLLAKADELRVFERVSEGMRLEIDEARRLGIPVVKGDLP